MHTYFLSCNWTKRIDTFNHIIRYGRNILKNVHVQLQCKQGLVDCDFQAQCMRFLGNILHLYTHFFASGSRSICHVVICTNTSTWFEARRFFMLSTVIEKGNNFLNTFVKSFMALRKLFLQIDWNDWKCKSPHFSSQKVANKQKTWSLSMGFDPNRINTNFVHQSMSSSGRTDTRFDLRCPTDLHLCFELSFLIDTSYRYSYTMKCFPKQWKNNNNIKLDIRVKVHNKIW